MTVDEVDIGQARSDARGGDRVIELLIRGVSTVEQRARLIELVREEGHLAGARRQIGSRPIVGGETLCLLEVALSLGGRREAGRSLAGPHERRGGALLQLLGVV